MTHLRMARATSVRKPVAAPPVRRRALAFAVAAIFEGAAFPVLALPSGPQVVAGTANISQVGNQLTINNSAGAILNWQKFGIGANELVRFNQPSASSAVLNRVVGVDPSVLLGQLSSNGRVWLVNPAGILVGQGARIDTAAFVASTLNVANADFLAQRLNFAATPGAGSVVNQGQITTPLGGSVYLVGADVANEGVITTPKGETILAAGKTVELIDTATPGVKVQITGDSGNVTNLGGIVAAAGRIGIAGALVKNAGTLNASSVEAVGGRIFLRATKKIEMAETSKLRADGARGGNVTVIVEEGGKIVGELAARGAISAKGGGGFVETSAGQADVGGLKVDVNDGLWLIDPYDYTIDAAAAATIKGTLDGGGSIAIDTTTNTGPGAGASGNGDITVSSAITKSAGSDATLTLNAHNNINLNADITSTAGQLSMVFNPDLDNAGGGAVVLGTTTLNANGGTIDAAGKTVTHSTGTATIDSAITIGTLNLSGGTLTGSGAITIPSGGALSWTNGTLDATVAGSVLTTAAGATATLTAGALGANRVWNNSGAITKANGGCCSNFSLVGTLNNLSGGVFTLNDSAAYGLAGAGTFNNSGS
ncbi:MAG: filamentous hemagglutinin N-terminal domain-containing protein, partial [Rhodocyclales bacterium]|nr:filamentous hemagglutinin N-terminal domain-containing protein [Rhodocyclales bacterium]